MGVLPGLTLQQLHASSLLPENKLDGYSNQCKQSNWECAVEHNITHLNKSPSIRNNIKFIECKTTYMENIGMFAYVNVIGGKMGVGYKERGMNV